MTRSVLLRCVVATCLTLVALTVTVRSQTGTTKQIRATKGVSPVIDGSLDDPVWKHAEFRSDFLQKNPVEGGTPQEKTEVAVAYDDHSLYVAARMYCADPKLLRMHLDRRDNQGPAEQFIVTIDSYHDRRTGYGFGINTAGVRFDRYNPEDNENVRDYSFDPVWHGHTSRQADCWIAEMEIPFSQLRFSHETVQVWGINFNRWIPERNEDVFWIYVPKNETGWASRFGELTGLEGIAPSRRLELLPYSAGEASVTDGNYHGNPFSDGRDYTGRLGADLKMGMGPNLTLDATFNPDFGQVELDPAEVNLSAYETFFDERRPFFTEGSQILQPAGPTFFYSRRIGTAPRRFVSGDFIDRPNATTILGAAKVTGRLENGLTIGAMTAVTGREYARVYDTAAQKTTDIQIEPLTGYQAARVQKELGRNASTIGLLVTGLQRDLGDEQGLRDIYRRQSYAGMADWNIRFQGGKYDMIGYVGGSHIAGDAHAIARTQQSSARYYQRPDANYVLFDSMRTSLNGMTAEIRGGKRGGEHWLWGGGFGTASPGFEINDAGIEGSTDWIQEWGHIAYRENKPDSWYRDYYTELSWDQSYNYGLVRQFSEVNLHLEATLQNYYVVYGNINHQITGQDDNKTRGGPSMQNEAGVSIEGGFDNPYTSTFRFGCSANYGVDQLQGWLYRVQPYVSARLGTRTQLSFEPSWQHEDQPRQYVATIGDGGGGERTYGSRYVFSRIERSTFRFQIRANYFFSPDLSLEAYTEPFAASGRYHDFGELYAPNGHELVQYGEAAGTTISKNADGSYSVTDNGNSFSIGPDQGFYGDFGFRSFRSSVVLRWEFLPGSTAYFVWQRNLEKQEDIGRLARPSTFFDGFTGEGSDIVALKIAYWIPVS